MILNSSQTMQTSNPLGTSTPKRVAAAARSSASSSVAPTEKVNTAKQIVAEQAQVQAEQRMLGLLRSRDREVRSHESAHASAGGNLVVSGPSFTYQKGPDGLSYAIGGEVQLDVSPVVNNPEATLKKSEQIRRAALAPADPSSQDLRVASSASQLASRARVDIATLRREETQLEEQEKALAAEQNNEEATDKAASNSDSSSVTNDVSASLEANLGAKPLSQPSAAINAFMETAESSVVKAQSKETQINQFA